MPRCWPKKKAAYPEYRKAREQMQELLVAKKVATVVLEKEQEVQEREIRQHQEKQEQEHR